MRLCHKMRSENTESQTEIQTKKKPGKLIEMGTLCMTVLLPFLCIGEGRAYHIHARARSRKILLDSE